MTPRRVLGGLSALVIAATATAYGLTTNRAWVLVGIVAALLLIIATESDTP